VPDLEDYFLVRKISRLQQQVAARGLHAALQITDGSLEEERLALERFAAMHCSAVVLIASKLPAGDSATTGLANAGVPLVWIDPMHAGHPLTVSTDRAHAMSSAVRWLHARGHGNFVTLGISSQSAYGKQRLSGIRSACKPLGMDFEQAVSSMDLNRGGTDFEVGRALGDEFVNRFSPPYPAVLALNDRLAFGFVGALLDRGLKVPDQVSVIGYDDADFGAFGRPALTTIDPQVDTLIDRALEALFSNAEGDSKQRAFRVKPTLIERESAGFAEDALRG
jgi:DNA-binding LacI/PurR family transcriptional regulator